MNILIMTNSYFPGVGGVESSIRSLNHAYRKLGHRVMILAPSPGIASDAEEEVRRIAFSQQHNGLDFTADFPNLAPVRETLAAFRPDIIHSFHPHLLGGSALQFAYAQGIPIVYTHHTLYVESEQYAPKESSVLKSLATQFCTAYANLCDGVIAPSDSVAELLSHRGVVRPLAVIPTGVESETFREGNGSRFRAAAGIPENAFVIGHVGRLGADKNIEFLMDAAARLLSQSSNAFLLVIGEGEMSQAMRAYFERTGISSRVHFAGSLGDGPLSDAYNAMNAFAYTSLHETQGLSIIEALAAGVPVAALDSGVVREVIRHEGNGVIVPLGNPEDFVKGLLWIRDRTLKEKYNLKVAAAQTSGAFSLMRNSRKALNFYGDLAGRKEAKVLAEDNPWTVASRRIRAEWGSLLNAAPMA